MTRTDHFTIGPRRHLRAGDEATIALPGRKRNVRARFRYADEHGNLTFTDSRTGAARTVPADAVVRLHRASRLRQP